MIGIIGAMEQEVSQVVAAMTDAKTVEIAGMIFNSGKFCGKDVIVVKSGIGNPVFGCFITYKLVSADNSSLKYTKFRS